jgi:hypothetical protein
MMRRVQAADSADDRFAWCSLHGERPHASVHEAGHAVAAIDRGIPILSLRVHRAPTTFEGARSGETASGAVRIDRDSLASLRASGTVRNRDLFTFVLAGEAAERVLLGHETPRGAAKDVREFWAWTKGRTFTSMDEYEEVLGEPFQVARQRVWDWAELRGRHIEALALRLDAAGQVTVDELRAVAEATMI